MRLINKMVLFAALLTVFSGLLGTPQAFADEQAESYFFNRRQSADAEYALVGPHSTLDATNAAIRWSMDNGYEVEWEADGSAPRILVENAVAEAAPTKVIVVKKIVYVTPRYDWGYWYSYRKYWRTWKVKVRWHGWKHYHGYKFFKHKLKHKVLHGHKVLKLKKKLKYGKKLKKLGKVKKLKKFKSKFKKKLKKKLKKRFKK